MGGNDESKRPVCTCQLHSICPRSAFYRMNALEGNAILLNFLTDACAGKSVLCIGEGSLLGLYLAERSDSAVIVNPSTHFRRILHSYVDENEPIGAVRIVGSLSELDQRPHIQVSTIASYR